LGVIRKAGAMRKTVTLGLIGDYSQTVSAHQAIPLALQRAADVLRIEVDFEWVPTDEVTSIARISRFDGLWCVPASPYRSMAGALLAIRHARENAVPFLGTCGGFQHAVVEYARNVLTLGRRRACGNGTRCCPCRHLATCVRAGRSDWLGSAVSRYSHRVSVWRQQNNREVSVQLRAEP
jgi:CTP synthase (UTP-ammonia lyase)